jgi:hypothetical protein
VNAFRSFRVYVYVYIAELRACTYALLRTMCVRLWSLEPARRGADAAPLDILVTHTMCPRPETLFLSPLALRPSLTILNPDFMMLLPVHPRDAARGVNFYSRV